MLDIFYSNFDLVLVAIGIVVLTLVLHLTFKLVDLKDMDSLIILLIAILLYMFACTCLIRYLITTLN